MTSSSSSFLACNSKLVPSSSANSRRALEMLPLCDSSLHIIWQLVSVCKRGALKLGDRCSSSVTLSCVNQWTEWCCISKHWWTDLLLTMINLSSVLAVELSNPLTLHLATSKMWCWSGLEDTAKTVSVLQYRVLLWWCTKVQAVLTGCVGLWSCLV